MYRALVRQLRRPGRLFLVFLIRLSLSDSSHSPNGSGGAFPRRSRSSSDFYRGFYEGRQVREGALERGLPALGSGGTGKPWEQNDSVTRATGAALTTCPYCAPVRRVRWKLLPLVFALIAVTAALSVLAEKLLGTTGRFLALCLGTFLTIMVTGQGRSRWK